MSRPPDLVSRLRPILAILWKWTAIVVLPFLAAFAAAVLVNGLVGFFTYLLVLAVAIASIGLRQYPVTAFGTEQRVDEDLFVGEHERCSACDMSIDRGQKRRYAEQYVAFGYPLYTTAWGENAYCPWCADGLESPAMKEQREATRGDSAPRSNTARASGRSHHTPDREPEHT